MAAIDLTQIGDYSWADLKKAAKHAMLTAALGGGTLTINGRTVGRITIDQAKALYDYASDMITAEQAGDVGTGNVLVNFREMS